MRVPSLTEAAISWRLATKAYPGPPRPSRLLKRAARAWLAAWQPEAFASWRALLEQPALAGVVNQYPRIWFKVLNPYLSCRFDGARRLAILRDTYRLLIARSPRFTDGRAWRLATLPLGELGEAGVEIAPDQRFEHEGEVVVRLVVPKLGGTAVSASLSLLETTPGTWTAYIGAIQTDIGLGEEGVKTLHKAMHGLRPKSVGVLLAQEVARNLGASRLLGVGNRIHVHRTKRLIHIDWLHRMTFDYDALWQEHDGKPAEDGWHELPLRLERRTRDEIKPNKRSLYAKRYAMLDDLEAQVARSLAA